MIPVIDGCGTTSKNTVTSSTNETPKAELIYCSFSETRHGGLGKDYCELIADPGTKAQIKVRLNIGNHLEGEESAVSQDFTVRKKDVRALQDKLEEGKVKELNGYYLDEQMTGGATYRIYMEYSDGEKINASWFGHEVKAEAWAAYNMIVKYFRPWIEKCSSR